MFDRALACFFVFWIFFFSGCSSDKRNYSKLYTPAIYKAWDARYHYDSVNRQMIPVYNDRKVGKAWGRDRQGRMNFAQFYDAQGNSKEDLLVFHKMELDRERGRKWDELNRLRMERITERLLGEAVSTDENATENVQEDDAMDFLPTPFIPAGIEMNPENESNGENDPSPFLPLPMSEEAPPSGDDPSPFLPLAP